MSLEFFLGLIIAIAIGIFIGNHLKETLGVLTLLAVLSVVIIVVFIVIDKLKLKISEIWPMFLVIGLGSLITNFLEKKNPNWRNTPINLTPKAKNVLSIFAIILLVLIILSLLFS